MHSNTQSRNSIFGVSWNLGNTLAVMLTLPFVILIFFITLTTQSAQGQTYNVIHNFTGGQDGGDPWAGPTLDRAGNLYGTAFGGGIHGYGVVYKLARHGSSWLLTPLYSFTAGADGGYPVGAVTFGPDGTLFGTTTGFGTYGAGTVFDLRPQPKACSTVLCSWNVTSLYQFSIDQWGNPDWPAGNIIFDSAGNLDGTTTNGGTNGFGSVYELTPSGGGWTESDIYSFDGDPRGSGVYPGVGIALDSAGDLYGTSYSGGAYGLGTVFELTRSGSNWTETILYSFNGIDGSGADGGVVFDRAGNLYGGTLVGGVPGRGGVVYELSPSNQGWTLTILHTFTFSGNGGIRGNLTVDSSGNIYGATVGDGAYGQGSVFKLTPSGSGWSFTDLYEFTGGSDGGSPLGGVAVDARGNLYGTASQGGAYGWGVVWEITP